MKQIVLLALLVMASCGDDIVGDDFGPPAGWSRVNGAVFRANGSPAADMEVLVTACALPVGGLAGSSKTSATGVFTIDAKLPPTGWVSASVVDTMQTGCVVIAGRGFASQSIALRWSRNRSQAPAQEVTLREGDAAPALSLRSGPEQTHCPYGIQARPR